MFWRNVSCARSCASCFDRAIPAIGSALRPMHIPVLLCGFFCGPWYAGAVGFIAPLLRSAMFGMPHMMPTGIAMCFELATYGLVAGRFINTFQNEMPMCMFPWWGRWSQDELSGGLSELCCTDLENPSSGGRHLCPAQ